MRLYCPTTPRTGPERQGATAPEHEMLRRIRTRAEVNALPLSDLTAALTSIVIPRHDDRVLHEEEDDLGVNGTDPSMPILHLLGHFLVELTRVRIVRVELPLPDLEDPPRSLPGFLSSRDQEPRPVYFGPKRSGELSLQPLPRPLDTWHILVGSAGIYLRVVDEIVRPPVTIVPGFTDLAQPR